MDQFIRSYLGPSHLLGIANPLIGKVRELQEELDAVQGKSKDLKSKITVHEGYRDHIQGTLRIFEMPLAPVVQHYLASLSWFRFVQSLPVEAQIDQENITLCQESHELLAQARLLQVDGDTHEGLWRIAEKNFKASGLTPRDYALRCIEHYLDTPRVHGIVAMMSPWVAASEEEVFHVSGFIAEYGALYHWNATKSAKMRRDTGTNLYMVIPFNDGKVQPLEEGQGEELGHVYWVVAELLRMAWDNKSLLTKIRMPERHGSRRRLKKTTIKSGLRALPDAFYEVVMKNEVVAKAMRSLRAKSSEWAYRTDRRAHERVKILRGPKPISPRQVVLLGRRKYTVYLEPSEAIQGTLEARLEDPMTKDEWVAILRYQVREHVAGPKDKPYVPHVLVMEGKVPGRTA